jgi:hypothetical protein
MGAVLIAGFGEGIYRAMDSPDKRGSDDFYLIPYPYASCHGLSVASMALLQAQLIRCVIETDSDSFVAIINNLCV